MAKGSQTNHGEVQELQHKAWPHFREAFIAVFVVCSVYLGFVFLSGGGQVAMGH